MRRYLLDTGPLTAFLFARRPAADLMRPWTRGREAATSILVYAEVVEYIKGLPDVARWHTGLRALLRGVRAYDLTYPILERYADLRRQLRSPHGPGLIGDIDTLVAATALEYGLTVVTTDRDFERVPSLRVQLVTLR